VFHGPVDDDDALDDDARARTGRRRAAAATTRASAPTPTRRAPKRLDENARTRPHSATDGDGRRARRRRDGDGREKKRWTHDLVVQGRVPDVAQLRRVEGVAIHARIDRCGAFEDVARAMVGTTRLTARERRR
jgi:hypothetical protein